MCNVLLVVAKGRWCVGVQKVVIVTDDEEVKGRYRPSRKRRKQKEWLPDTLALSIRGTGNVVKVGRRCEVA